MKKQHVREVLTLVQDLGLTREELRLCHKIAKPENIVHEPWLQNTDRLLPVVTKLVDLHNRRSSASVRRSFCGGQSTRYWA